MKQTLPARLKWSGFTGQLKKHEQKLSTEKRFLVEPIIKSYTKYNTFDLIPKSYDINSEELWERKKRPALKTHYGKHTITYFSRNCVMAQTQ